MKVHWSIFNLEIHLCLGALFCYKEYSKPSQNFCILLGSNFKKMCLQATAEANNLAAVASARALYQREMEEVPLAYNGLILHQLFCWH